MVNMITFPHLPGVEKKMQPKWIKNATKTPFIRMIKEGIKFHNIANLFICNESINLVL